MFKSNRIKKLLAFSVVSSGILFYGISASAVKAPPNSGGSTTPNILAVRRPVFSPEKHLKKIMRGDPEDLGPYKVINLSGLLVDLEVMYPGIGDLTPGTVQLIKYLHENSTD